MSEKSIANTKQAIRRYDLQKPSQMTAMANVLKGHIVKHKLYTDIQGKNYAHVEGWQFAGFLLGMYPVVESVENLSTTNEMKWKATVEIVRGEEIIGRGIAICSSKESKKKSFDEYAILSMAQTRAIGKAYRNMIGWVMKLAGYETTPTEEMKKMGDVIEAAPAAGPSTISSMKPVVKNDTALRCQKCAKVVDEAVANYSMQRYGKILCRDDQPKKR